MSELRSGPTAPARPPASGAHRLRLWEAGPGVRLLVFLRALLRQTLLEPVAEGRLREVDWPYGLRAVVVLGYAMFGLAGLLVVLSGAIRRGGTLILSGTTTIGLPESAVWPLLVLLSFALGLLMTAALQSTWWLKLAALVICLLTMGSWGLRGAALGDTLLWTVLTGVFMLALLVFVVVRWRRRFAWWEMSVIWGLVSAAMVMGVVESRYAKQFGTDFNPLFLQETAATLGYFALPAATVAGASVAEVTVRATVSATQSAQRLVHRRWPYAILAVLVVARLAQAGWQLRQRDPVLQSGVTFLTAAALLAAFGVVGLGVHRLSRRHEGAASVADLGDDLSRISFVVAALLIAMNFPVQVLLAVVQILGSLDTAFLGVSSHGLTGLVGKVVDPMRILLGLALLLLAGRTARRGRRGPALVTGCVGVMLVAMGRGLFFGDSVTIGIDADALNLLASALVVLAAAVTLVRRRLTPRRALAFAGVLILSALFSYRDFISDPVGTLLGFSGAALVLFGLVWDLLTGAQWGNGESRRFARPARVLLVLTNSVLTMTVLAFAALVRDGSTTVYLDPYAGFGDLIFGTALLAAAVIAVFDAAWHDRPLSATSESGAP